MPKTVLALYKQPTQARGAITDLIGRGLHPDAISIVTAGRTSAALADIPLETLNLADTGEIGVRGPVVGILKAARADERRLAAILRAAGIPDPDSGLYAEGVRRGATLVLATVPGALASAAADALDAHSPEDPDNLTIPEPQPQPEPEPVLERPPEPEPEPAVPAPVPVVAASEEDLGGVVVSRDVSEVPVEQPMHLTEERVEVERRPADRVATEAELRAFEPGEMVFVDTSEEIVITKVPHVVEEIVIRKTRRKREEVVRDTVRRSEVRIEPRRA